MWSHVTLLSHRDLLGRATLVVLSTANGTALTLSATHLVYVSKPAADSRRVPARAGDVKVCHCCSCWCTEPATSRVRWLRSAGPVRGWQLRCFASFQCRTVQCRTRLLLFFSPAG